MSTEKVTAEQSFQEETKNGSGDDSSSEVDRRSTFQQHVDDGPKLGGTVGWLRVVGAHFIYISTWGLLKAYGSYVKYYKDDLLRGYSPTDIAWPGTIQGVLIISVGVLSGPLFDRGYMPLLLLLGSFLVVFGMMMLSLSSQYYQIVLSQGICVGLGSGLIYVPTLAMVSISFTPKMRPWALGVATCGAAVGGTIFPIALQQLLLVLGFGWATRVLAFLALFCLGTGVGVILLTSRETSAPVPTRALVDWKAFKDSTFTAFCLAMFCIFLAYLVPFFYIPEYVRYHLDGSSRWSVYTLVLANAATLPGRLIVSLCATRFGATESLMVALCINAIVLFCWYAVNSLAGMDVWAIVFGFVAGPLVPLPATVVSEISPDLGSVGTRMGMAWMFAALGGLVGAPVAGYLNGSTPEKDFTGMQGLVGAAMVAGAAFMILPLRTARRKAQMSAPEK